MPVSRQNIFVLSLLFFLISSTCFAQNNERQKLENEKKETLAKIAQAEKILAQNKTKKKSSLGQ